MNSSEDPFQLEKLLQRYPGTKLAALEPVTCAAFLKSFNHGDLPRWFETLDRLPEILPAHIDLKTQVNIGQGIDGDEKNLQNLQQCLESFIPWRKGPFTLFDIDIDSEWCSNLKWDRLLPHIQPLKGRIVMDVGCGNGYHCLRAAGEEAELVIGLEPYLLYVMQFLAVKNFLHETPCYVVPIRLEQFPGPMNYFDTVFSMGVIYHQKSPIDHLLQLKGVLRKGGELVLETLVIDGGNTSCLTPVNRYARMSNVWFIPSNETLIRWLEKCGFIDIRCVDVCTTSKLEQRRTHWMPYQSLADSLNPTNDSETIEGFPAPKRSIVIASVP